MPFEGCCCKFIIFRREYLSSAANVLKNGPKLSILTRAGIFQLYLSILMEKWDNSGSVLISAVFETREDLD